MNLRLQHLLAFLRNMPAFSLTLSILAPLEVAARYFAGVNVRPLVLCQFLSDIKLIRYPA
jgi:hypothetical protein